MDLEGYSSRTTSTTRRAHGRIVVLATLLGLLRFLNSVQRLFNRRFSRFRASPRRWGCVVSAVTDRLARNVVVLVVPSGLDQQPAGMTVAGLRDRPV